MKKIFLIAFVILLGVAFNTQIVAQKFDKDYTEWKRPEHHRPDNFRGERQFKHHMKYNKHKMRHHMMKMNDEIKALLSEEEIVKFDSLRNGMKALWKERDELHEEMQALREEIREVMKPHKDEIKKLMQEKFEQHKE